MSSYGSGASAALYGPSTEQASKETPRDEAKRVEVTTEPKQEETTVAKFEPEKTTEEAASKPKPKPEPDPDPKPKPEPKRIPAPVPTEDEEKNDKYDATVTVTRVIDGDTVEISPAIDGIEDVRLIGIDTPETVDPGEEVEPYGPEASAFATDLLTGRDVELEFDQERVDQYDRLLAYVYTSDGEMLNENLMEEGLAQAYPYAPNTKYEAEFAAAQDAAASAGLGIWSLTPVDSCLLADRGNGIGDGTPECVVQPEPEPLPVPGVDEAPVVEPASPDPAPAVPSGGDLNCSDFATQADAQSGVRQRPERSQRPRWPTGG